MYPSVSGTPNSFATSNLKRSNAPFASGTAAWLEDFVFDISISSLVVVFIFDCFGVAMLVYEARRIILWKFSYTKEEHGKFIAILYFLRYNYI
ncbi:hypothetical protein F110043I8_17380 [Ruminococcus sp. f11]